VRKQFELLEPEISQPGYRDKYIPVVANSLLYSGYVEEATRIFDLMRHGDVAGYWREIKLWVRGDRTGKPLLSHEEIDKFRADGEAEVKRFRAKYGGR
jgi:hypothetical protein